MNEVGLRVTQSTHVLATAYNRGLHYRNIIPGENLTAAHEVYDNHGSPWNTTAISEFGRTSIIAQT